MGQMDMTQNIADKTMIAAPMPDANATIIGTSVKCPVCGTENSPTEKYCGDCGFLLASTPGDPGLDPGREAAEIAPQAKLIASDREHLLKTGENTIGREGTDVLLEDQTVSRRHALLVLEDGKCCVEDLGSTNGTAVDGGQIAKGDRVEVASGAELKFGSSRLTLDLPEPTAAAEEPTGETETVDETADGQAAAGPVEQIDQAQVEDEMAPDETVEEAAAPTAVANLIGDGVEYAVMPGANSIGRRGDNDIVLSGDPYVSGSHAQITAEDGAFTLVDVGSTNGTMLNGARVEPNQPVSISAGDEIVFGKTAATLQLAE